MLYKYVHIAHIYIYIYYKYVHILYVLYIYICFCLPVWFHCPGQTMRRHKGHMSKHTNASFHRFCTLLFGLGGPTLALALTLIFSSQMPTGEPSLSTDFVGGQWSRSPKAASHFSMWAGGAGLLN